MAKPVSSPTHPRRVERRERGPTAASARRSAAMREQRQCGGRSRTGSRPGGAPSGAPQVRAAVAPPATIDASALRTRRTAAAEPCVVRGQQARDRDVSDRVAEDAADDGLRTDGDAERLVFVNGAAPRGTASPTSCRARSRSPRQAVSMARRSSAPKRHRGEGMTAASASNWRSACSPPGRPRRPAGPRSATPARSARGRAARPALPSGGARRRPPSTPRDPRGSAGQVAVDQRGGQQRGRRVGAHRHRAVTPPAGLVAQLCERGT